MRMRINFRSTGFGILYLVIGLVGGGIGVSKVLPALFNMLGGLDIDFCNLLPWLLLSLAMIIVSGGCLWYFAPIRKRKDW